MIAWRSREDATHRASGMLEESHVFPVLKVHADHLVTGVGIRLRPCPGVIAEREDQRFQGHSSVFAIGSTR
jgi:hypothetical protein